MMRDMNNARWCLPALSSPMPGPTPPQEAPMSLVAPPASTTDPSVSDPHLDNQTDDEHDHFMLDRPAMHIGQKQRARDLQTILEVCTCGSTVMHKEISRAQSVIECTMVGCKTRWVSERFSVQWNHRLIVHPVPSI